MDRSAGSLGRCFAEGRSSGCYRDRMTDTIRLVHTEPGAELSEWFHPLHARRFRVGVVRYVIYVNKPRRNAAHYRQVSTVVIELNDSRTLPVVETTNHALLRELAKRTNFPEKLEAERVLTAKRLAIQKLNHERARREERCRRQAARIAGRQVDAATVTWPEPTEDAAYLYGIRNMRSIKRPRQSGVPVPASPSPAVARTAHSTGRYWLNAKTGKRHRLGCRYYGCQQGRSCHSGTGIACEVCGG